MLPSQECRAHTSAQDITATFGGVEIRQFTQGTDEVVLTYPHPNIRLFNERDSGGVYSQTVGYMFRDQLGSVRGVVEGTNWVERSVYRPFGDSVEWVDPAEESESHNYIGERRDETGLMYLNARYYDPALGHFLSPDWFPVTKPGVGVHRYGYAGFDPVNQLDPGGNETIFVGGAGENQDYREEIVSMMRDRGFQNPRVSDSPVTVGPFDSEDSLAAGNMFVDAYAVIGMNGDPGNPWMYDPRLAPQFPDDEQYNLVGYSWGSVIVANQALSEIEQGGEIDNLVLIGAPLNQSMMDRLRSSEGIRNLVVLDLDQQGDPLYAGITDLEITASIPVLIYQMGQSSGHFYYNLSGAEGRERRQSLIDQLSVLGLR